MVRRALGCLSALLLIIAALAGSPAHRAAAATPITVMALGDSITAGWDPATMADGPGYRDNLSWWLNTYASQPATIIDRGTDGATISQNVVTPGNDLMDHIDGYMTADQPTIVLLDIGTNDCAGAAGLPLALLAGRLENLVQRILDDSPTVVVMLAKVTLSRTQWPNINEQTYNGAIATIIAEHPGRVYLADQSLLSNGYLPLTDSNGGSDGFHPNSIGYEIMSHIWYDALRAGPLPGLPARSPIGTQLAAHNWYATWNVT